MATTDETTMDSDSATASTSTDLELAPDIAPPMVSAYFVSPHLASTDSIVPVPLDSEPLPLTKPVVSSPVKPTSVVAPHLTSTAAAASSPLKPTSVVSPPPLALTDSVVLKSKSVVSPHLASVVPLPLMLPAVAPSSLTSTTAQLQGFLFDRTNGPNFNIARHRLNNTTVMPLQKNALLANDSSGNPSPSTLGQISNKGTSSSSSATTTQNLMALLGDIKQSQMMAENDQKALDQNRSELKAVSGRMNHLAQKKVIFQKQISDGEVAYAELASELSFVTIKDKVLVESLTKLQTDLAAGWECLTFLRSNMTTVSSRYLGESTKFAMMYNCTELGAENRANALHLEFEESSLAKNQLEYDLQKFLSMLTEVEKSEAENKELQQQYRAQEENDRKKEVEAYNKLSEMERLLEQLEKRKASLDRALLEETKKLHTKLESTKQSISYWERRVSENQRMVYHQKNSTTMATNISSNTINSSTSPGFPSMSPGSIRLGNGQTVLTNNKIARVSQYVHVPPVQQTSVPNKPSNTNTRRAKQDPPKTVQTKLQFNPGKSTNLFKPTKPKFNPPCVNVIPTVASKSFTSNAKSPENDDSFNDSFSSSQYFKMPESKSCNNANSSNQNISNTSYSSASGRTFQFKKKPSVVQGPATPCRSASVPLGTMPLPFSTFQTGRAVLQEKQLLENSDFDSMDTTITDY